MRIAFLCKRRYMAKDVILDRYARLYELPRQLALLGHQVHGYCLSYQGAAEGHWDHGGGLEWSSRSVGRAIVPRVLGYAGYLRAQLRRFRPDLIIGASDIPHVALAGRLSRQLRVPYAVDLYDNFESFGQARFPGMVPALKRAVRDASVVTTTSALLADHVRQHYGAKGAVIAMPSAIDPAVFHPRDRRESREALGLPLDRRLVGTAGSLHADKGVGTLYDAWRALEASRADVDLVLAGPTDIPPPQGARVHYLGMLPHASVATLFSALDVSVIYVRDTPFGKFCFPQKAYEMAACGSSIVASRVGATAQLFERTPAMLYAPDDARDLTARITQQLDHPILPEIEILDWTALVARAEPAWRRAAGIS